MVSKRLYSIIEGVMSIYWFLKNQKSDLLHSKFGGSSKSHQRLDFKPKKGVEEIINYPYILNFLLNVTLSTILENCFHRSFYEFC